MPSAPTFVIVGASLGGAKAAEALRAEGFGGQVVLIGAEPHFPYERPPLSKGYLQGSDERSSIFVHDDAWYAAHAVDLRLGTTVTAIDRGLRQVALASGETVGYDRLLLTTGAAPVRLPVAGADTRGVLYLRTVDDSERLRETLASASRVAVIGAGWIGLEVAAAARLAGVEVTVLEAAEVPLLGALGPEAAQVFLDLHREHGVDFRPRAEVAEITVSADAATGVRLTDGTGIGADAVIIGIGVAPSAGLAEAAGLETRNGIVTDASLRTSDPAIYAAGDAARAFHPWYGRHLRVEHWSNALHQPAAAARAMLGQEAGYDRLPYFFTDQYDLGMEYTGYVPAGGYDRVVFRGDVGKREFIAFWLSGGRVLAGMNVNVWDVTDEIKELIRAGRPADPGLLADPGVALGETLAAR